MVGGWNVNQYWVSSLTTNRKSWKNTWSKRNHICERGRTSKVRLLDSFVSLKKNVRVRWESRMREAHKSARTPVHGPVFEINVTPLDSDSNFRFAIWESTRFREQSIQFSESRPIRRFIGEGQMDVRTVRPIWGGFVFRVPEVKPRSPEALSPNHR